MALVDQIQPTQTPAVTQRASALRNLASQIPGAQQKVAQQFQAGQALQLQQAVKAAPPAAVGTATAQQVGALGAQQAGQQQVQQAQQIQQAEQQVGALSLQEQGATAQKAVTGLTEGARADELSGRARLAKVSEEAARELYDGRLKFAQDELGRTHFQERQLADYARLNARNEEELKNYAQRADQITKDAMRVKEAAYKKLASALESEQLLREQGMDSSQIKQLYVMKQAWDKKLAKEKREAAVKSSAWAVGGMAVGAVAGGFIGGPAGAAAGATIGSGLGQAVAAETV